MLSIFYENSVTFFQILLLIESSKEQHLSYIEIFYNTLL